MCRFGTLEEAILQSDLNFSEACLDVRRSIIETAFKCGQAAHIGGSLSMVEILTALFGEVLVHRPNEPTWNGRDIFILSKGHAVLGYFAVLCHYGYFPPEKLATFQTNGSDLIAHPVKKELLGIESSNGSLGQGLAYGMGMALGMRRRGQDRRVYVMLGDGECNEGSVWESAASAAELGLGNLTAIIDENGFRNDGPNTTYAGKVVLANVWKAFGWNVIEIDGHDHVAILNAFRAARDLADTPTAIVARTIKGKGVDFMEANNDWHHNRITASIMEKCLKALEEQEPKSDVPGEDRV
ncbi:MAG: transketolase [Acetobacter sp.]|uniref:transketolase n=1 Tax=Acetobacter sp. TaxID=440 RepID=UPI0039E7CECC